MAETKFRSQITSAEVQRNLEWANGIRRVNYAPSRADELPAAGGARGRHLQRG